MQKSLVLTLLTLLLFSGSTHGMADWTGEDIVPAELEAIEFKFLCIVDSRHDIETVQKLIEIRKKHNISLDKPIRGMPLLIFTAQGNFYEGSKLLLEAGCKAMMEPNNNKSVLHFAYSMSPEHIKLFLDYGADPFLPTKKQKIAPFDHITRFIKSDCDETNPSIFRGKESKKALIAALIMVGYKNPSELFTGNIIRNLRNRELGRK